MLFEAVCHDGFHRLEDAAPGGVEYSCGLFPGKSFGPYGQEQLEWLCNAHLAVGPWNPLHFDTTGGASDAAHSVPEDDPHVPERNEVEIPLLGHPVVDGTLATATGAMHLTVFPGSYLYDKHIFVGLRLKIDF